MTTSIGARVLDDDTPPAMRHSRSADRWSGLIVLAGVVVLLAPLRWFTVVSAGGVGLELVHVALAAFVIAWVLSPGRLPEAWAVLAEAPGFWLAYVAYLLTSLVFLAPYGISESFVNLLPQILYVPAFFLLNVTIVHALLTGRTRLLRMCAGAAVIGTFASLWVSAELAGLDPAAALARLFSGGTIHTFNRTFTSAVFNFANSAASPTDASSYATSIANELISCLVVLYAILRAMRPAGLGLIGRLIETSALCTLVFLATVAFSRSGLLACVLTFGTAALVGVTSGRLQSLRAYAAIGGATCAVAFGVYTLLSSGGAVEEILLDPTSTEDRLEQFRASIELIDAQVVVGTGGRFPVVGTPDIHNLFLGTWIKGGIIPLCLVLFAYLSLLIRWVQSAIAGILRIDSFWALPYPFHWVMTLPIVMLFRVFLSGKGGTLSVSMWLSAAAFLAFVAANAIARRSGSDLAERSL